MKLIKREQQILCQEFDPYVYCKFEDKFLLLSKKDFDQYQNKLWDLSPKVKRFNWWSDQYLENYRNGKWWEFSKEYIEDPIKYLRNNNFTNIFYGSPSNDGFLYHLNGNTLNRKILLEFWKSYYPNLEDLEKELRNIPVFSDFVYEKTPYYNIDICGKTVLRVSYQPTQEELDLYIKNHNTITGSYGEIHNKDYIKKYYEYNH